MIYLFSGDDTKKKLAGYEKFIGTIPKNVGTFFIDRNNFDLLQIESLYSGSNLFTPLSMAIFKNVFEHEETRNFILEKMKFMGESINSFVFLDGKLNKPILNAFKKSKAEINIFELPKEKKERFDNFMIANAFANKDKLNTWIYFRQSIERGVAMEEIVGILFWKIKDMILKKNVTKYSLEQLKDFASKLSYLLPEARKKGMDAEAALEKFLLESF